MDLSPCSRSKISDHRQSAGIKNPYPENKRTIVLALVAPTQMKKSHDNPPTNNKSRRPPPSPCRPLAATAVSVFKFADHLVAEEVIARLNLSGCAVISKGVLVVEGPIGSVERFSRAMGLAHEKPNSVIWRGNVCRPRFGKFCILRRCSSDFIVRKFFADHGASHYWDLVVRSTVYNRV